MRIRLGGKRNYIGTSHIKRHASMLRCCVAVIPAFWLVGAEWRVWCARGSKSGGVGTAGGQRRDLNHRSWPLHQDLTKAASADVRIAQLPWKSMGPLQTEVEGAHTKTNKGAKVC